VSIHRTLCCGFLWGPILINDSFQASSVKRSVLTRSPPSSAEHPSNQPHQRPSHPTSSITSPPSRLLLSTCSRPFSHHPHRKKNSSTILPASSSPPAFSRSRSAELPTPSTTSTPIPPSARSSRPQACTYSTEIALPKGISGEKPPMCELSLWLVGPVSSLTVPPSTVTGRSAPAVMARKVAIQRT